MCVKGQTSHQEFSRLPTNVKPIKYTIDYDVIDLDRFRFEGTERVTVEVVEATSTITCHAVELWVHSVSLAIHHDGSQDTVVAADEVRYITKDESVTFVFPSVIPAGTKATLSLQFHGILNDKLKGFYRSQYTQDGESRTMAVTQFEASDARRALVCWDEPAIKASFQLSMVTPVDREAISNTPVLSTLVRPSKTNPKAVEKVWQFDETPVMSTYLLAMVVGEFDFVSGFTKEGVVVRVYTPVGRSDRGKFALRVATQCLSFFTAKFGIPYPLAKLDMLAIPDFNAGAMENWGIVTYRESILLADEATSSFAHLLGAAHTVCHELAHQWFGNLVTMEWWTELWLNEGFARFMEHEAMHALFPQWNVWANFVQDPLALKKDSMVSSHPIEVVVHHPDEIDQVFDVIAYRKGAAVIRMLANFIGTDKFYVGMHEYLTKFAYGNAKTVDLWESLEAASGLDITKMAHTWTTQTGFPVVSVQKNANGSLELAQQRFFADGTKESGATPTVWDVPLTFVTPSGAQSAGIWPSSAATFQLSTPPTAEWVKLNAAQQGFYLVNYSPNEWTALKEPVATKQLGVVDRVALLQTIFVLARAGHVSVVDALAFAEAYALDTEYLVWKELSENLLQIIALFDDRTWFPSFQAYIRRLYAPIMARLTWHHSPSDSDLTKQLRRQVIGMLGRANDPDVVAEATRQFDAAMAQKALLPVDFRADIYRIYATTTPAPDTAFAFLTHLHSVTTEAEVRLEVVAALGLFPQEALKRRVLTWGFQHVRSQDIYHPFAGVAATAAGAAVAWSFVQSNWDALTAKYDPRAIGRILAVSIRAFNRAQDANAVQMFLLPRQHPAYSRTVEENLEGIHTRHVVATRDGPLLQAWLAAAH